MNFYRRRPLALALSLGIVLSAVSVLMPAKMKILLMIFIAAVTTVSYFIFRGRFTLTIASMNLRLFLIITAAISLPMLLTSYICYDLTAAHYELLASNGETSQAEAVVVDIRYESGFWAVYTIRTRSVNGESKNSKGVLFSETSLELSVGDIIEFEMVFIPLDEAYSFYGLNRYDMMANENFFACELKGDFKFIGETGGVEVFFSRLRGRLCAATSLYLGKDASALTRALLLDDRSDLNITFINRDFARIGASHILALSGLHISVLCGITDYFAKKFYVSKNIRSVISIGLVIFYMFLTAFPYSVVRAGIMLIVMNILTMLKYDTDSVSSLFCAGALILLCNPPALFDIGFEMSFAATLGIILLTESTNKILSKKFYKIIKKNTRMKYVKSLIAGIFVTIGAVMFIIPLQYLHFGETSILTIVSTLMITPFCELLLWLLPFYMLASATGFSFVSGRLGWIVNLLANITVGIASKLAKFDSLVSLKYPFVLPIIIAFTAVIIIMMYKNVQGWIWSLIPFGISVALFFGLSGVYRYIHADDMILCRVYDKNNDAFTLITDGHALIADISDGSSIVMRYAVTALSGDYITEIDTCMLTHLHRRHAVSLRKLCETRLVRRFLIPEPLTETEKCIAADLCELAAEAGAEVVFYPRPDETKIRFGNALISIFGKSYISRSTHPLIGVKFSLGSAEAVYIGSTLWEDVRADEFVSGADVVFYGRHGPNIKSSPNFIFSGNPKIFSDSYEVIGGNLLPGQRITVKP